MMWILIATILLYSKGCSAQNCGTAPLNTKIVGGGDAAAGAWPWQVSMHFRGTFICGGTLISSDWVLTAAHCMLTLSTSDYTLYLGRRTESGVNPNQVSRGVSKIIRHPQYNNTLFNNDITLMKLSAAVVFTDYIRPVCLAGEGSLFRNATLCWASGWGNVGKEVPLGLPQNLQEVEVPVVGNRQCTCAYRSVKDAIITNNMICAGQRDKGTCQGDSGGPVQCQQGSVWIQAGITSYGVPCATGRYPEVYARVSQYQTWITDNMGGASANFLNFSSNGNDPDNSFVCPTSSVTTSSPNHSSSLMTQLSLSFLPLLLLLPLLL